MKQFFAAANQGIFGYGSPVTMGLFRAILGSFAFINYLMIAIDFDAWFTERGFVPIATAARWNGDSWRFNPLAGVSETWIVAAVYTIVTIAALFTALGLWTRVSTIVLALGTIALHHRNPIILHGGDTVLRQGVILLAVAPCGLACSLDRLLGLAKGKLAGPPREVSLWPQRLVQYQIAVIYFTAVWAKWQGNQWRDGTATWYPPQLTEFTRFPFPEFLDRQPFTMMTTYGTLVVELALATLVFHKPLRKWVLGAGLLLHGVIEYRFNIPLFAFMICSFYVCFYEGQEVSSWARRFGERFKRFKIQVPKMSASPASEAVRATDPFGFLQESSNESPGAARVWSRCIGAWFLLWWPPLWLGWFRKAFGVPGGLR